MFRLLLRWMLLMCGLLCAALALTRLISSQGRIAFVGRDIAGYSFSEMRPLRNQLQIVFQDPYGSLNPRMTVGESIIEGPMNFGLKRPEALARGRVLREEYALVRRSPKP